MLLNPVDKYFIDIAVNALYKKAFHSLPSRPVLGSQPLDNQGDWVLYGRVGPARCRSTPNGSPGQISADRNFNPCFGLYILTTFRQ